MKNYIYLAIIALVISSCASTKDLKNQNQNLSNQVSELKANVKSLSSENKTFNSKIKGLESTNADNKSKLAVCKSEVKRISSIYSEYSTKIKKMKAELEAAFPNNLNDANFAIIEEDGRLIVRLPNSILYRSGDADFNNDALLVVQKLSKVFRANQGLNILVEGHTDHLQLRNGSKYEDNWDLSLARAVKIVRQLESYGVHPQRLTAAGRANFAPLDRIDSDEARAKNRRTEIIIRPKIAEVIKVLSELK